VYWEETVFVCGHDETIGVCEVRWEDRDDVPPLSYGYDGCTLFREVARSLSEKTYIRVIKAGFPVAVFDNNGNKCESVMSLGGKMEMIISDGGVLPALKKERISIFGVMEVSGPVKVGSDVRFGSRRFRVIEEECRVHCGEERYFIKIVKV